METMTTGRFPFSGGSVGSFVNQISPRCGTGMRKFLLVENKSLLGKFAPSSLLLDFLVAQAVVVSGDLGFERCSPLFRCFFQKQVVQDCGLGVQLPFAGLLLKISQTLGRESEGASPLITWVHIRHSTLYHIIDMIDPSATLVAELPIGRRVCSIRSSQYPAAAAARCFNVWPLTRCPVWKKMGLWLCRQSRTAAAAATRPEAGRALRSRQPPST